MGAIHGIPIRCGVTLTMVIAFPKETSIHPGKSLQNDQVIFFTANNSKLDEILLKAEKETMRGMSHCPNLFV